MATVSFHLKDPKSAKPTAVFIWFNPTNGQPRIRLYTGEKILPAHWTGADVQRANEKARGLDEETRKTNARLNKSLDRMSARLLAFWGDMRAEGKLPSAEQLRAVIEPQAEAPAPELPRPLPDFVAWLVRLERENAANTIKGRRSTYRHLVRFTQSSGHELDYADFTRAWRDRFAGWLAAGAERNEQMGDASVNKQLNNLKAFLADAALRGRTPKIDVKGWNWKFAEPEVLALTEDELARVEALDGLPGYLENARGLWLLMAYTGLRYSDAAKLRPVHDKGEVLQLVPKKTTDRAATVYVRRAARALLERVWSGALHETSNQKINAYIKVVCARAGLDALTEKITYYDQTSRVVKETFRKWELVSCHTARRTFITRSFAKLIPLELIMQAAGHANAKTTLRYNQTSVSRQVEVSRRAWDEE
ncbi:tyrosine-type recombinase/integrase [Hymenobacter sp.]|uniref:tyrosine-type recombinase/integrase n=1 Tax=Hymenobacter sp. TaxID=1898978 RepID=UPI00286D06C3|nr:tyrosine-type recombinase/integrase [Hymenobacter sp.]